MLVTGFVTAQNDGEEAESTERRQPEQVPFEEYLQLFNSFSTQRGKFQLVRHCLEVFWISSCPRRACSCLSSSGAKHVWL
jgi:hypothetical protein